MTNKKTIKQAYEELYEAQKELREELKEIEQEPFRGTYATSWIVTTFVNGYGCDDTAREAYEIQMEVGEKEAIAFLEKATRLWKSALGLCKADI